MSGEITVAEGNTTIHQYPDAEGRTEIWSAVAAWAISPRAERVSQADMVAVLNEEFPGLGLTEAAFGHAIKKYVAPAIPHMLPAAVLQGLAEAEFDFNTALTKADAIKKLKDSLDAAPDVDKEGRSLLSAKSGATRTIIKGIESIEDTMERFSIIPSKKQVSEKTQVNINVNKTLNRHGFTGRVYDATTHDSESP